MIEHHLQALEIAALAPDRAGSDAVRSFAERVTAAQGPEVHALASWLQARDLAVPEGAQDAGGTGPRAPDGAGHDHGAGAAGMLSDEQLAALEAASGPKFDRLFLEGMIQHHEGALAMVDVVLVEGEDLFANEMAAETAAGQGRLARSTACGTSSRSSDPSVPAQDTTGTTAARPGVGRAAVVRAGRVSRRGCCPSSCRGSGRTAGTRRCATAPAQGSRRCTPSCR